MFRFAVSVCLGLGLAALGGLVAQAQANLPFRDLQGLDSTPLEGLENLPRVQLTRSTVVPPAIDLSPAMPPAVEQDKGSCVSFTVGYAMLGYHLAQARGFVPGDPAHTPSPAALHTMLTRDSICEEDGSHPYIAAKLLEGISLPSYAEAPLSSICTPAAMRPPARPIDDQVVGMNVIYLRSEDRAMTDRHIGAMKQQLAKGYPVAIGVDMYCATEADMQALRRKYDLRGGGRVSDLTARALLAPREVFHGSLRSGPTCENTGHAMTVIGYDDARAAVRIQNSWGPDFGEDGRIWMSYEALKVDASVLLTLNTRTPPTRPTGKTEFIAETVALDPCHGLTEQGGVVSGFVASETDRAALARELGPDRTGEIAVRPWPVCAALQTLEAPLEAPRRPLVRRIEAGDKVRMGESLAFEVTTPDFPTFLYLLYFQADGTVVNLVPRGGPIRKQHPPATTLRLGDGQDGRQSFTAAPPAGPEAVIAIAARGPIFRLEDLEDESTGQFRIAAGVPTGEDAVDDQLFLSILSEALASRGDPEALAREVSADVLHLTITE